MLIVKRPLAGNLMTSVFYLLFFATPLLFEFKTRELFEFPKMIFVYLSALVLAYLYFLFRAGSDRSGLLLKPFLLLILAQAVATLFSMNGYTSFWGYYSRFNGGLLSLLSYFLIFVVLKAWLNPSRQRLILAALMGGGFFISFYALAQSLGLDKDFWVQDSQARAFSTLGQPNWLAAYLLMILPVCLHFYLEAKGTMGKIGYFFLALLFYFAFWSTFSLSGFFGFIFLIVLILFFSRDLLFSRGPRLFVLIFAALFVSLARPGIFGAKVDSFLKTIHPQTSFGFEVPVQASEQTSKEAVPSPAATKKIDTGEIRLGVWQGAFELWKSSPKNFLIGTGPETFAYAFLPFRPKSLNQTTEWDFLYNKAHNYYLDLLTGAGLFGFLAFCFFGLAVVRTWFQSRTADGTGGHSLPDFLFYGWATTFVTNLFGWPTVPLSLLFFTYPLLMNRLPPNSPSEDWPSDVYLSLKKFLLSLPVFLLIFILFINTFLADVSFSQGLAESQRGNLPEAEVAFKESLFLNFWEPAYHKELSLVYAQEATLDEEGSRELTKRAATEARVSLELNRRNSLTLRSLIRTYYLLARLDQSYEKNLEDLGQSLLKLAPTDPQSHYEAALVYHSLEKDDQAQKRVAEALDLKPDYPEAVELLVKLRKGGAPRVKPAAPLVSPKAD